MNDTRFDLNPIHYNPLDIEIILKMFTTKN